MKDLYQRLKGRVEQKTGPCAPLVMTEVMQDMNAVIMDVFVACMLLHTTFRLRKGRTTHTMNSFVRTTLCRPH